MQTERLLSPSGHAVRLSASSYPEDEQQAWRQTDGIVRPESNFRPGSPTDATELSPVSSLERQLAAGKVTLIYRCL